VARLLAPGARSLALLLRMGSFFLSRIVSLLSSRIALSSSSCIVSFVSSRDLVFASKFLTVARIVSSSFRVLSHLRFAYRPVFVSRIVTLRLMSFLDRRVSYHRSYDLKLWTGSLGIRRLKGLSRRRTVNPRNQKRIIFHYKVSIICRKFRYIHLYQL